MNQTQIRPVQNGGIRIYVSARTLLEGAKKKAAEDAKAKIEAASGKVTLK